MFALGSWEGLACSGPSVRCAGRAKCSPVLAPWAPALLQPELLVAHADLGTGIRRRSAQVREPLACLRVTDLDAFDISGLG
jgi:hypothetical protein